MTDSTNPSAEARTHTWSQAVENIGCGMIVAAFLVAVITVCVWGLVQTVRAR